MSRRLFLDIGVGVASVGAGYLAGGWVEVSCTSSTGERAAPDAMGIGLAGDVQPGAAPPGVGAARIRRLPPRTVAMKGDIRSELMALAAILIQEEMNLSLDEHCPSLLGDFTRVKLRSRVTLDPQADSTVRMSETRRLETTGAVGLDACIDRVLPDIVEAPAVWGAERLAAFDFDLVFYAARPDEE